MYYFGRYPLAIHTAPDMSITPLMGLVQITFDTPLDGPLIASVECTTTSPIRKSMPPGLLLVLLNQAGKKSPVAAEGAQAGCTDEADRGVQSGTKGKASVPSR